MQIHTNIPLNNFVTMRLGGNARFMADAHNQNELKQLIQQSKKQNLPIYILGEGSNTVVKDEGFNGIVIKIKMYGFDIITESPADITIKLGAGEIWDDIVKRCTDMNLTGIECLSYIPGTVGAAPVQNIGAYGQELSETMQSLEAYDTLNDKFITLSNDDCHFSYRDSMFRSSERGRYIIISITLKLLKASPQPPFYKDVEAHLTTNNITIYTPKIIRKAIGYIRENKLPDPKKYPNNGSFFKNAIIEKWQLDEIKKTYPDVPVYNLPNNLYKIPTGWLIEQTGLKGNVINGIKIHDKNALVLINESAKNYTDLEIAKNQIIGAVRDKFRIIIEQEPLILSN